MDERKNIKPFETVCPKCGEEQVTEELNFSIVVGGTMEGDMFVQSNINCNKCKYSYPWRKSRL